MIHIDGHTIALDAIAYLVGTVDPDGQPSGTMVYLRGGGSVHLSAPHEHVHAAMGAAQPVPFTVELLRVVGEVFVSMGWTPPSR